MRRTLSIVSLLICLCACSTAADGEKPVAVELWPGKVPDETADLGPERVRMSPKLTKEEVEVTEPTRLVTDVSQPTLTIYRPAKDKDTGAAIRFDKVIIVIEIIVAGRLLSDEPVM